MSAWRPAFPVSYAIGDVNGKQMLAHTASAEGLAPVENIMGGSAVINYDKIPACIYTFPEVAMVGLTEQEAVRRGHKVAIGTFPPWPPTAGRWRKASPRGSSRSLLTRSTVRCWVCTSSLPRPPT